jgi:hypothetical protein
MDKAPLEHVGIEFDATYKWAQQERGKVSLKRKTKA